LKEQEKAIKEEIIAIVQLPLDIDSADIAEMLNCNITQVEALINV
jgi:hypothetical protein